MLMLIKTMCIERRYGIKCKENVTEWIKYDWALEWVRVKLMVGERSEKVIFVWGTSESMNKTHSIQDKIPCDTTVCTNVNEARSIS